MRNLLHAPEGQGWGRRRQPQGPSIFPAPQSEAPMSDVVTAALGVRHEEHPRRGPLDAPAHDRRAHAEYVPRPTFYPHLASRICISRATRYADDGPWLACF